MSRKVLSVILVLLILAAAAGIYIASVNNGTSIPDAEKMYLLLERKGYDVQALDSIMIDQDELLRSLEEKGYGGESFDDIAVDNEAIPVERVYAEKNGEYIDICYDVPPQAHRLIYFYFEDIYEPARLFGNDGMKIVFACSTERVMRDARISLYSAEAYTLSIWIKVAVVIDVVLSLIVIYILMGKKASKKNRPN